MIATWVYGTVVTVNVLLARVIKEGKGGVLVAVDVITSFSISVTDKG